MTTVQQLVDSLLKFDPNAPVEIAISQYTGRFPVAYVAPRESYMVPGMFADMRDGQHVRIHVILPHDDKSVMITQTRRKK